MVGRAECADADNERRAGWYLQQLLKLYAHAVVPGLSEHYLVLNADVFLLCPTRIFLPAPENLPAPALCEAKAKVRAQN